jgi:solute carrier family 25 phosphate transporter 23/24/25/41
MVSPKRGSNYNSSANIAAAAVTLPQEVVKTRLTQQRLSSPKYIGVIDAFTLIVKEEGWGALFKGWLPTIIGIFTY